MDLVKLRDKSLDALNAFARSQGQTAQKNFIDQYATSQTQLRALQAGLLSSLSGLKDDSADSQIQAAIILFRMKVTPVVVVHVPFGGDNHSDGGLANEVASHGTGVATIATMMQALSAANLEDQVTFAMMNVFGRTMVAADVAKDKGRQHNDLHHVTVLIGSGIKSSVVGGVAQAAGAKEYGALAINSATGEGSTSGDITFKDTFGAMGKTLAAAAGLPSATIDKNILTGSIVKAAVV
jgi:hypothetical protein